MAGRYYNDNPFDEGQEDNPFTVNLIKSSSYEDFFVASFLFV